MHLVPNWKGDTDKNKLVSHSISTPQKQLYIFIKIVKSYICMHIYI